MASGDPPRTSGVRQPYVPRLGSLVALSFGKWTRDPSGMVVALGSCVVVKLSTSFEARNLN
jgi:hypothetical protein